MSGPRVTTGVDSKQNYATPADFIAAVERRFGPICFDLAAEAANAKHARWFGPGGEAEDSLSQSWHPSVGLLWLNPPFNDIAPWAAKCAAEAKGGSRIALLVPASVGSNWFRDHVAPYADTHLLNGRLSFDGKSLYPKDCLIAHYHGAAPSIDIWNWKRGTNHSPWSGSMPARPTPPDLLPLADVRAARDRLAAASVPARDGMVEVPLMDAETSAWLSRAGRHGIAGHR